MVGSAEWALLEWIVPIVVRVQLDLNSSTQLLPLALVLLAVGGLLLAATVVRSRVFNQATGPFVGAHRAPRIAETHEHFSSSRTQRMGSNGPRAPSV